MLYKNPHELAQWKKSIKYWKEHSRFFNQMSTWKSYKKLRKIS